MSLRPNSFGPCFLRQLHPATSRGSFPILFSCKCNLAGRGWHPLSTRRSPDWHATLMALKTNAIYCSEIRFRQKLFRNRSFHVALFSIIYGNIRTLLAVRTELIRAVGQRCVYFIKCCPHAKYCAGDKKKQVGLNTNSYLTCRLNVSTKSYVKIITDT